MERIAADLALFAAAAKQAHEAATHEENIPDNKYDTLSLEASYLAQGQANRAQELRCALHGYQSLNLQRFPEDQPIRLTALVTLEADDGEKKVVFLGPEEGGLRIALESGEVMVITAGSPLGSELIGRHLGDCVTVGKREYEVVEIC